MAVSQWLDGVHLLGIAAGLLGAVALILGVTILVGLKARGVGYDERARWARRNWHMACGASAVLLGLAHVAGRAVQNGELNLHLPGPVLVGVAAAVLGVSGLLRWVIPWRFSGVVGVFIWLHRVGVVGGVYLLARHVHYQLEAFLAQNGRS